MHTGESQRPSGTENRENGSSAKPCARELFAEAHRQLHVSVGSGYEDILSALKTKKNFIRRKYSGDDLTIRQKIAEADNAFEVLTGSRPPPTGHGYHTNTRSSGYSTRSSGYSTRSSSNSILRKERRWTEEDEAEYQRAREREELETRKRHCETLGVKMSDGLDVIKKVYRQEALKHHPDRTGVASHSEFVRIDEAYKWLVENAEARNKLEQTTGY
jgi:curved DNA-binding protein CbpA